MESRFHIISSEKEVDLLIEACLDTKHASFDFETNARPLYNKDWLPTIVSVAFQPGSAITLPLAHYESPFREKKRYLKLYQKFGRKVIENNEVTKFAWNWKFDEQVNHLLGVYNKGVAVDAMLAKYLLNEERPHDLKSQVKRYLPDFANYEKENNIDKLPWDKKPLEPLSKYGCLDADATLRLGLFFENRLIECDLYALYRNLIMMASRVLLDVEKVGIPMDIEMNKGLVKKYADKILDIEGRLKSIKKVKRFEKHYIKEKVDNYIETLYQEIEELQEEGDKERSINSRMDKISRLRAGEFTTNKELSLIEPVNFASTKQMVDLLFLHPKGLKLPILEYTKDNKNKPTENPSTAEDVLEKLKDKDKSGFINVLLELRGIQTINSTFIVGLGELIQDDGRIHPSFFIHGTTSGRLSSRKPNGQNIPKMRVNPDVKPQLIPLPGYLWFSCDYSQAELRILAHLAKETTMLEWFRDGRDIHLASACKKYNKDYDEIYKIYEDKNHPDCPMWEKYRKQAKTINFGIVYEQSAQKLAESLSDRKNGIIVTVEEAQTYLDEFFELFPRIKRFMDRQHKFMEKNGYCVSLFGRKRRCPKVYSDVYREYLEALRQSTNMPCQSAASDMALFSSVLVWEEIKRGNLPRMIECNTVHDSVMRYAKPEHLTPDVVYKIWNICRNPQTKKYFGFSINDVDMSMDFTIGRHMGEELPYIPGYDYNLMLRPDFDPKAYKDLAFKYKDIQIKDYPEKYKQYFKEAS